MRSVILTAALLLASHSPVLANWYVLRAANTRACTAVIMQPGAIYQGELVTRHPSQAAAEAQIRDLKGKGQCAESVTTGEAASPASQGSKQD
jgi:hypothetical protein